MAVHSWAFGLWAPGVTPRLFNLDVSPLRASDIRTSILNRRYAGTLVATFADNSPQFSLPSKRFIHRQRGSTCVHQNPRPILTSLSSSTIVLALLSCFM
jgi:hypothetical protein